MKNPELERGRAEFRNLLFANPNYFGTYPDSGFKVIEPIQKATKYEEIGCVGFDPTFDRLEAVVYVKQPYGYGGNICTNGTPEFVRFYLSFDDGVTWVDQGTVSFRAYDIPQGTEGMKRLEYAVSLPVDGLRRLCGFTRTVLCRAILSWNNAPTPNTPDFTPVWGDVHDTHLLTEPLKRIVVSDFLDVVKVKAPDYLLEQLDPNQEITLTPPEPMAVKELAKLYSNQQLKVEPSRFAFKEVQSLLNVASGISLTEAYKASPLAELDIDLDDLVAKLPDNDGDGDTSYEELECVGLFPNEDLLIGTFRIKRPGGYNGNPCSSGSKEYVAFWADFNNNGTFETYLGTASTTVYDFKEVPEEGLEYAVTLPVDLDRYRQPCTQGPRLVRIRAILSWNTPPDPADPDYVPYWGNREETTIHIAPGPVITGPGAYISILGGIPVGDINDVSGYTDAAATFALNGIAPDPYGRPCPFAGRVVLQGPQFAGFKYRVSVRQIGTLAWTTVATPIQVTNLFGNKSTHSPDGAGMFTFLSHSQNIASVLAWWNTNGDALWEVRLEVYNPAGTILLDTDKHRIQLDNTFPDAAIEITSGSGDCGTFTVGDVLTGTFKARDAHLRNYSLSVLPSSIGPNVPSPSSGLVQTPFAGQSWTLNTAGMQACGYVIEVGVRDRAIRNSASVGHFRRDDAGFCLKEQ